jgi:predicted nucleic acid-binding protein
MAMMPASQPSSVTIDANVLIALCAKEVDKYDTADAELTRYARAGALFYAPGVIVAECLYVLCKKREDNTLSPTEHAAAVSDLGTYMGMILPPPQGEQSLIARAEQIRSGYGCSRSSDGLYLALTEALAGAGPAELLTFDSGLESQARANAPSVVVRLLVPSMPTKSASAGAPPSSNP